jgi:biotin transport system substrate-specific component
MEAGTWVERYYRARSTWFQRRREATTAQKLLLALGMAGVTGLAAQAVIPLPWTPVPITGQVFAVLLSAILLGRRYGGLSQVFYVGLGAAGLPWFAGWGGGAGILTGATGGYLIGFILAALLIGHISDKYMGSRNFLPMFGLMLFANFAIIHGLGLLWLGHFLGTMGIAVGFYKLLWMGMIPFIAGDVLKIAAAAGIAKAILPKAAYKKGESG